MSIQNSLSRTSFEEALTSENLRITRIIQSALMAGSLLFALVVVFVSFQHQDLRAKESDLDTLAILTLVHIALLIAAFISGRFLSNRIFSPAGLTAEPLDPNGGSLAQRCVRLQRTAILLRLASLEGVTFFGLALCMMAATNGAFVSAPQYWMNFLSVVLFLGYGIVTFPTKERLVDWYERTFIRQSL